MSMTCQARLSTYGSLTKPTTKQFT